MLEATHPDQSEVIRLPLNNEGIMCSTQVIHWNVLCFSLANFIDKWLCAIAMDIVTRDLDYSGLKSGLPGQVI